MSTGITFRVEGEPKGQPRPRAFAMKMADGKYSARVFDGGTAEGWKSLVATAARPHVPAVPIMGPVRMRLIFSFARPKKHFTANKPEKGLRADAPVHHVSKPDNDNLQKAILDTLTQLGGFWKDDAQIAEIESVKFYAEREQPGVLIWISEIQEAKAA